MPFAVWTRVGPRKRIRWGPDPRMRMGSLRWRKGWPIVKYMCACKAAFCQVTVITCLLLFSLQTAEVMWFVYINSCRKSTGGFLTFYLCILDRRYSNLVSLVNIWLVGSFGYDVVLLGRAIRHKDDYAAILLLDHRYLRANVRSKLPRWISDHLRCMDRFGPAFSAIRQVSGCFKLYWKGKELMCMWRMNTGVTWAMWD